MKFFGQLQPDVTTVASAAISFLDKLEGARTVVAGSPEAERMGKARMVADTLKDCTARTLQILRVQRSIILNT